MHAYRSICLVLDVTQTGALVVDIHVLLILLAVVVLGTTPSEQSLSLG